MCSILNGKISKITHSVSLSIMYMSQHVGSGDRIGSCQGFPSDMSISSGRGKGKKESGTVDD